MDPGILREAYASPAWRRAAEELHEALGVSVSVVHASIGHLSPCFHAELCDGLCPDMLGPSLACLALRDDSWEGPCAPVRGACEAGLPCTIAPVRRDTRIVAYAMVSGYVGGAAERKRAFQRLLAGGLDESEARRIADAAPVLNRDRANACAGIVAARAELVLAEEVEASRARARQREISALSDVSQELGAGPIAYDRVPPTALVTLLRLTGSVAARLTFTGPSAEVEPISAGDVEAFAVADDAGAQALRAAAPVIVPVDGPERPRTVIAVPVRGRTGFAGVLEVVKAGDGADVHDDLRLMELFAEISAAMLVNAAAFLDTNKQLIELVQVNAVAKALNATLDRERLSELAVQVLSKTLDFGIGGFVTSGFGRRRGTVLFTEDVTTDEIASALIDADGIADQPLEGVDLVPQLAELAGAAPAPREWTVLSCDLTYRNVRAGTLFVASRHPGAFRIHDERILGALAEHLSIALENATLYERLDTEFQRAIAALSALADAQERRADGHTDRLMDYAMDLAREMGLPLERVELVRFAALLHDVGKAGIAEEILLKPSELTPDEMERVRRHSEMGANIVEQIRFLEDLTPIVRHHHERWDGAGYPDGLAGEDIPVESRVLSVVDAWEVMTSKAAHRRRLPAATARLELQRGAGEQFDPRAVVAFFRVLDRRAFAGAVGLLADTADGPQLPA